MDFELNGKHLIATDTEKNLSNDELRLSIGAGGGFPNRIITPKKAGTLTITGTIYRNGQFFRDVSQTYKVEGNTPSPAPVNKPTTPAKVTVKKTTLKSAKNAKGNKTKTISKNKTTSYTIKKLKKKKTYYSGWSSVKKATIKK